MTALQIPISSHGLEFILLLHIFSTSRNDLLLQRCQIPIPSPNRFQYTQIPSSQTLVSSSTSLPIISLLQLPDEPVSLGQQLVHPNKGAVVTWHRNRNNLLFLALSLRLPPLLELP